MAGPGTWPSGPSTCSARRPPAPIPASTPSCRWPRRPWSAATTPGAAALLDRAGDQLDRPFGYRWRVELRHAELASRLDPPAAEALLELARRYGSTKYQALALGRLGRRAEAAGLTAAGGGSDYVLAQVAQPDQARAALDRIAAGLPGPLRSAFLERGPLSRALRP